MQQRGTERPVATEPMGIVISQGNPPVEPPAAWAFVWGPADVEDERRMAMAA
jgi:hypothetical protein